MKLIVCLDDKNGMAFFQKRQSMDKTVCQNMIELTHGHKLWMKEYSAKLFSNLHGEICIDESYLQKAGEGDYCFAETDDVSAYAQSAEQIIVYRWNRCYPSDLRFSAELLNEKEIADVLEFSGNSHEKISREVYQ